jgi:hypothetical protein
MRTYDVATIETNAGSGTLARHLAPSASAPYCSCVATGSRALPARACRHAKRDRGDRGRASGHAAGLTWGES